ncbi:MAG: hypothetical protein PHX51_04960 [Clostridia bacterium]|nr:hypothetical protein [Clostridia bacterium]
MRQNKIDEIGYYMDEMRISMDAYLFGPIGVSAEKAGSPLAFVSKLARRVYTVLAMKGVCSMGELAVSVGQSTKSIHRPVAELAEKGIVEKYTNPEKKTQTLCRFTEYGKKVVRDVDVLTMKTAKEILESCYTDDELLRMYMLCKELALMLKNMKK